MVTAPDALRQLLVGWGDRRDRWPTADRAARCPSGAVGASGETSRRAPAGDSRRLCRDEARAGGVGRDGASRRRGGGPGDLSLAAIAEHSRVASAAGGQGSGRGEDDFRQESRTGMLPSADVPKPPDARGACGVGDVRITAITGDAMAGSWGPRTRDSSPRWCPYRPPPAVRARGEAPRLVPHGGCDGARAALRLPRRLARCSMRLSRDLAGLVRAGRTRDHSLLGSSRLVDCLRSVWWLLGGHRSVERRAAVVLGSGSASSAQPDEPPRGSAKVAARSAAVSASERPGGHRVPPSQIPPRMGLPETAEQVRTEWDLARNAFAKRRSSVRSPSSSIPGARAGSEGRGRPTPGASTALAACGRDHPATVAQAGAAHRSHRSDPS